MKKLLFPSLLCAVFSAATLLTPAAAQQTVQSEAAQHPRVRQAITELQEAIRELEAAPHNFGGHKAKAIADSKQAIHQLNLALAYRAKEDNAKKKR